MAKTPSKLSSPTGDARYIEFMRQSLEKDINDLKEQNDALKDQLDSVKNQLENRIKTSEERINKKLDGFDEAFRGNGRIGLFEQIRVLNKLVAILFILLTFSLGFEMFGVKLKDWMADRLGLTPQTTTLPMHQDKPIAPIVGE